MKFVIGKKLLKNWKFDLKYICLYDDENKKTITAILFILLLGATILCGAEHLRWKANWIGLADSSQPNTWLCYRKEINIKVNYGAKNINNNFNAFN